MSAPEPWPRAAVALALSLALAATWPLPIAGLRDAFVGHATGDLADHVQGAWWVAAELMAGRLPDTTTITHVPLALPLWYVDPVGALLALPLWGLGGAVAWNGALLVQVLAATGVAWAAGRDLSGSAWSGVVAAVVAGPSPYLLGLLHSGLSEYVGVAPLIAAVWASLRATGRDPRGRPATTRHALLAGVAMGLCAWQAFYYAAFAGLFLLCCLPGARWPERLRAVGLGVGSSLVVAAPALWAMGRTLWGGDGAVSDANAPGWGGGGPLPATDLLTWVRPGAYYFPDTPAMGNPGILHVNYLGGVALVMGAVAVVAALRGRALPGAPDARPLLGPMGLYGLLMLGPGLVVGGQALGLPLPLALLYAGPSPFDLVHHPYRMAAGGVAALGMLAAVGSRSLPVWGRVLVALLVVAETVTLSPAPWPLATTPAPTSPGWTAPPSGALLDWPPDATRANRRYQLAQVNHGRAVPWGVNVFLPRPVAEDPLGNQLLRALDDPRSRARNRDVPARADPVPPPLAGESRLEALGFGSVVLHRDALSEREWARCARLLEAAYGAPEASGDWGARWVVTDP